MSKTSMQLGPVMMDLIGTSITDTERQRLLQPAVGGVILFSRNYQSRQQITDLVAEIHALRDPRLIVAVDQEGGRVQRFKESFTRLPPLAAIGALYDQDQQQGLQAAETLGWLMAAEILSTGIDISFAPVLDMDIGISRVIGDRAFHHKPECTASLATAYIQGMQQAGMAATGKHFPGHGHVAADSHTDKPVDHRDLDCLMQNDIQVFQAAINNGLAAIMPSHVIYTQVDQWPAGYSSIWLQQILRQQLAFDGVIFSDDLSMVGADLDMGFADRARQALNAGCDMVLVCNKPAAAQEVIKALNSYNNPVSQTRLIRMQSYVDFTQTTLQASVKWQQAVVLCQQLLNHDERKYE